MPVFNIKCSHKYLILRGIEKWWKTNSFNEAKKIACQDNDNIYERLGKGKRADWYFLASNCRGHIVSEILGDLPID